MNTTSMPGRVSSPRVAWKTARRRTGWRPPGHPRLPRRDAAGSIEPARPHPPAGGAGGRRPAAGHVWAPAATGGWAAICNGTAGPALDSTIPLRLDGPSLRAGAGRVPGRGRAGAGRRPGLLHAFLLVSRWRPRWPRSSTRHTTSTAGTPPGTLGTLGAAAAAARPSGSTAVQTRHALRWRRRSPPGQGELRTMTKPFHAGHAARAACSPPHGAARLDRVRAPIEAAGVLPGAGRGQAGASSPARHPGARPWKILTPGSRSPILPAPAAFHHRRRARAAPELRASARTDVEELTVGVGAGVRVS